MRNHNLLLSQPTEPESRLFSGMGGRYFSALTIVLLGYALFGKGFASLGASPVYIGEVMLVWGLVVLGLTRRWSSILIVPTSKWLILYIAWGSLNTFPYVGAYGVDALRDGVIWGYSFFAFIVGGLLVASWGRFEELVNRYGFLARIFPYWIFAVMVMVYFAAGANPFVPWDSNVKLFQLRAGESMVHLAAIVVFVMVGFAPKMSRLAILCTIGAIFLFITGSRASMSTLIVCISIGYLLSVRRRGLAQFASLAVITLLFAVAIDLNLGAHGARSVSIEQVAQNFTSTFSSNNSELRSTKLWRLSWWKKIIDYTFFGDYFLTGKGFGINIASADGFQVASDESLRAPHSIHFSVLARAGVPGLFLWLAVNVSWAIMILRGYFVARQVRSPEWVALFTFLLAYWAAFLTNGSFDVYLEGPMGGVWFWTIIGIGIAAKTKFREKLTNSRRIIPHESIARP